MFLPARVGTVWFPVSALISGLLNLALVWAATHWTTSARVAALPLWTWLATVFVLYLGGPGGDNVLILRGWGEFAVLVLLVLGVGPAVWLLSRGGGRPEVTRSPGGARGYGGARPAAAARSVPVGETGE